MRGLPERGPLRLLAAATFVNTIGGGLWIASSALFLTRSVGLSVTQTGLAFSITALVCLASSAPAGYLTDRIGPRRVLVVALIILAIVTSAMTMVHSFQSFLILAVPMAVVDAAQRAARGAVIARAVDPAKRLHARAYLRSVTNVGLAVGTGLAGIGLAFDTRAAYVTLILGNAASFVAAAGVLSFLAPIPPVHRPADSPRLLALRDRPFMVFVVFDGMMATHLGLLEVALPLWISFRTDAPHWTISVLFIINTVGVILFQVRAARGTDQLSGAGRAARRAGLSLLVACAIFSLSGLSHGKLTLGLLIAAACAHLLAELLHSAAGWSISFGLAKADAHGQYQGAYSMGGQLGQLLAPLVVTALTLGWGAPGWLVLGVGFAVVGWSISRVVRWAQTSRAEADPASGPTPASDPTASHAEENDACGERPARAGSAAGSGAGGGAG